jgi:peptidoglycan hydrolase CwlO-like protein
MNSSASDKALLDKLFDEKSELKPAKPTSQNNTGADGKMLKNLQNKLRYVQDELNTTMKEKNEAVKKLKMDKTQLSAALMHTTDRLDQQKKRRSKKRKCHAIFAE